MTVNELIQQLRAYPGDMRVLTIGYEGGLNDARLDSDDVVFDVKENDAWYYGPHEYAKLMDGDEGTECVIIFRA